MFNISLRNRVIFYLHLSKTTWYKIYRLVIHFCAYILVVHTLSWLHSCENVAQIHFDFYPTLFAWKYLSNDPSSLYYNLRVDSELVHCLATAQVNGCTASADRTRRKTLAFVYLIVEIYYKIHVACWEEHMHSLCSSVACPREKLSGGMEFAGEKIEAVISLVIERISIYLLKITFGHASFI